MKKEIPDVKRKPRRKRSLLTYVIYALIATVVFTGFTFSRYTATVKATDETSAAIIALSQDVYDNGTATVVTTIDLTDMKPGDTQSRYIKIRSADQNTGTATRISRVTQTYTMTIASLANLPLNYTLTAHNISATGTSWTALTGSGGTGPISLTGGRLLYGDNTNIYKLDITWPNSTNALKDSNYSVETERLTITVTGTQE